MIAVLAALVPIPAVAAPAGLDPSFGSDGAYRLDMTEPSLDVANDAAVLRGHLVAAGSAGGRFALAPLDPQSEFAFNNLSTQVIVDFAGPSVAHAVVARSDDLTAAGAAGGDFAIVRLRHEGAPDQSFGDQGRVRTSFGAPAVAFGLADALDSTTLAVGTVGTGAGSSVALVLYDPTGTPVPSFGTGGKVVDDITAGTDSARAVAATSTPQDGLRFLVAGQAGAGAFVARYLAGGGLDPSFGTAGRVILDLTAGDDVAHALSFDGSGRILVAGSAGTEGFVARLSPAGVPDADFGAGGVARTALGGSAAAFRSVQPSYLGTVVVAGTLTRDAGKDAVVARFHAGGAVDASFGTGGRTVVDLGGTADEATAAVGQAVGSRAMLHVVGTDGADMVAATVDTLNGTDPYSGGDFDRRKVDFGIPTDEAADAVTVLPDGRILVAGSGTRGIVLIRLLADGSPDPTFGSNGVVTTRIGGRAAAMAVVDGRILVAGVRSRWAVGVFAFTAAGALDPTYGDGGFASTVIEPDTSPIKMAALPGGHVVVGRGRGLARLDAAGTAVWSYQSPWDTYQVAGIAGLPDGRVVVLDRDSPGSGGAGLKRFNQDGSEDGAFGLSRLFTASTVLAVPSALLRLADGRFVVGGRTLPYEQAPGGELVVAGFTAQNGSVDGSFGTGGVTVTPVPDLHSVVSLIERTDGRIVAVHSRDPYGPSQITGLTRYQATGQIDASFGDGGTATAAGVHPHAAALAPGGKIVVAGRTPGASYDLIVTRPLPRDLDAPATFHPLSPVRLLDTRDGTGQPAAGRLPPGGTLSLAVTGRGGVPVSGVSAVVLNVTVTEPTAVSFLTAYPAGYARPLASNLNYSAGQTVPNLVIVRVGAGGRVEIYNNSGSAHVVADLAGWYGAGGTGGARYSTLTPARILDTRIGDGAPVGKVGPGATLALQVTGRGGVPASGVSAVVLNVTATEPTTVSYLTAWPSGTTRPLASNLNYTAGQTVPNLVVVPVGAGGGVSLYNNHGSVHLVADVAGWYGPEGGASGAQYSSVVPARLLDTRAAFPLGPGSALSLQVTGRGGVPATGVTAVVLNVTVTEPSATSFLTVWPAGEARPLASNLNYVNGLTVPNLVAVKVGAGGKVDLYNHSGTAHIVVDVAGWYDQG